MLWQVIMEDKCQGEEQGTLFLALNKKSKCWNFLTLYVIRDKNVELYKKPKYYNPLSRKFPIKLVFEPSTDIFHANDVEFLT